MRAASDRGYMVIINESVDQICKPFRLFQRVWPRKTKQNEGDERRVMMHVKGASLP